MTSILDQSSTSTVHYIILNPESVERFFTEHPDIKQVLRDAEKPLQAAFGKNLEVSVAVAHNPEDAGGEFLVSSIQTSLSATQARTSLDQFDEIWWLDNAPRAEGQLIFTVSFT